MIINTRTKPGLRGRSSLIFSLLFITSALMLTTLTSFAQKASVTNVPFDVTVNGGLGECTEINWPLHLTGVSHFVIRESVRKGIHHISIESVVTGTATDAAGNTFGFNYALHEKTSFEVSLGDPTTVDFDSDHFNLVGPAGHISVGFVGSSVFDEFGNFVEVVVEYTHGNYLCDPI